MFSPPAYNEQLVNIYNSYKNNQSDTFAVAYQPANIDINTFPIDALRWIANLALLAVINTNWRCNLVTLIVSIQASKLINGWPR